MTYDEMRRRREALARAAVGRFRDRSAARDQMLGQVDAQGVLAAAGVAAATRRAAHMTVAEGSAVTARRGRAFEAILGMDDSDSIGFLGRGLLAARAVCRLVVDRQPIGTGFLIAPGVLLTNNHVIVDAADAAGFIAEFDYELDAHDQPRVPVVRFAVDPERLFTTSQAETGLDYTVVNVAPRSTDGGRRIEEFGWIPLDRRIDKILVGEPAMIVQHPRGELKRICLFDSELVDKLDDYLHYTTDTDHGSSGSCVFNRAWQLVALHHASAPSDERRRGLPVIVNEGIRVSRILASLEAAAPEIYRRVTDPSVVGDGRPQVASGSTPAVDGGRRERIEVVLETTIGRRPADWFALRSADHFGYKPDFLGVAVPLPHVPEDLADDVAAVGELRYTHYSVLQSASRCLPIVTAVNIDGKSSKELSRTDRKLEAADRWFFDPRLDENEQLGPEIYDRTAFDFGHMVRREDPVWGEDNVARMANDDTFYMTNCAPQHHDLNTRTWLALENAILRAARATRRRVSVFTGPVLSPQDPTVLRVQVPTAFWKIVAYADGGKLRAHGFMQFQTRLVSDMRDRREAMLDLASAAAYAVPIAEIARVTALGFGPLGAADVLRGKARQPLDESLVTRLFPGDGLGVVVDGAVPRTVPAEGSAPYPPIAAAPPADRATAVIDDLRNAVSRTSALLTELSRTLGSSPPSS